MPNKIELELMLQLKRSYELPEAKDGYLVLVDRLWPRGVSKEKAQLDKWLKGIAPSSEFRTWFGHKSEHFEVAVLLKYHHVTGKTYHLDLTLLLF